MSQPVARPPRTDVHRKRDELIALFAARGLQPVVSTNGSIPDADIQQVKGIQPGDITAVWLTAQGEARLHAA